MTKENYNTIRKGFRDRKLVSQTVTILLAVLTILLAGIMLMLGNTNYSPITVVRVLMNEEVKGATFAIGTLRLPRMLAGLMVGLSFGIAGNTFQTMLRNTLASPDMIGVTSGSSMAAIFSILILKISGEQVSMIAVISGIMVAGLLYLISKGGGFSGGRLILIGIGIQAMLNAVISYLLLRANQYDVPAALRWLSGSLNGIKIKDVPKLAIVLIIFGTIIIVLSKQLRIMELGEQSAISLGLRTNRTRLLLIISSVFLIAFATSVTGPIAFVAFLSGPIARRLVGFGASIVIPSGFVGASLVLGADIIGQYAFDIRFPVGIITGILGAPYLLYLLIRMNRAGGAA